MSTGSRTVNDVLHAISQTDDLDTEVKYKNIAIKHYQNLTRQFESVRRDFLKQLIDNIESRFLKVELNLLECFDKIFNPKRYPDIQAELVSYGNEQLNSLYDHYSDVLDVQRCKGQFLQFKHFVVSHKQDYGDFDNFCKLLLSDYGDVYPDLVIPASIALVIPVSSAPCERGFSQQHIFKLLRLVYKTSFYQ